MKSEKKTQINSMQEIDPIEEISLNRKPKIQNISLNPVVPEAVFHPLTGQALQTTLLARTKLFHLELDQTSKLSSRITQNMQDDLKDHQLAHRTLERMKKFLEPEKQLAYTQSFYHLKMVESISLKGV